MGYILNPFLFIFFGRLLFIVIVEILLSNGSLENHGCFFQVTISYELKKWAIHPLFI